MGPFLNCDLETAEDDRRLGAQCGCYAGGAALLLGVVAAAALQNILFKVEPLDPFIYLAVSGLLTLVAAASCFIPARRATRVNRWWRCGRKNYRLAHQVTAYAARRRFGISSCILPRSNWPVRSFPHSTSLLKKQGTHFFRLTLYNQPDCPGI
jgi:hypothetical protein